MKYLLDAGVWLWMHAHPERIGRHTMKILTDERNDLLLSAASWDKPGAVRACEHDDGTM